MNKAALTTLTLLIMPCALASGQTSGAWCLRDSTAPSIVILESETLPPCCSCRCDWDQSGVLGFVDLDRFSEDWLNENADYDADGVTSVHDAVAFLECYFGSSAIGVTVEPGDNPLLRAQGMDY